MLSLLLSWKNMRRFSIFFLLLLNHIVLYCAHAEGTIRYNKHNWDGKSYILDPSWIIDNGLNGNDILPSSFLKKHADSRKSNSLTRPSYLTTDSIHYNDNESSGIIPLDTTCFRNVNQNIFCKNTLEIRIMNLFFLNRI